MGNKTIRVGITGIGGYARIHLEILLEEQAKGRAELVAAVVSFPQQDAEHLAYLKARSPNTRIYSTLDEAAAAERDLDLMLLPVGIGAHRELTLKSLAAGWNVMVEKPLAGSVADAQAIVDADEASGRFVAVGYQDLYGDPGLAMKAAVASGAIGEVRSVRVFGIWGRPLAYYRRASWAGKLLSNGQPVYDSPFNNALSHYLNLALFLAGPGRDSAATPVGVEGWMRRAHEIESCDTACLRWQTTDGPEVGIFFSHASSEMIGPEMRVQGTSGELYWKYRSHWELRPEGGPVIKQASPELPQQRRTLIDALLRRVEDSSVPVCTPRQALAQVQAVELAHKMIAIEPFETERITRCTKPDKDGIPSEWLHVQGLKEEGERFFST